MPETTPYDILYGIFAWGSMDIDHLCCEMDAYRVDPGDVGGYIENYMDIEGGFERFTGANGVNLIQEVIFEKALMNAGLEEGTGHPAVSIYLNCIDSHLSIADEEIYDWPGLVDAVAKLKRIRTEDDYNEDEE